MSSLPQATGTFQPIADTSILNKLFDAVRPSSLVAPSLRSLTRAIVLVASCGLLFSSSRQVWFNIPGSAFPTNDFSQIAQLSPPCQSIFQCIMLFGCILWVVALLFFYRNTLFNMLIAIGLLLVVLSFPYFILQSNPELAGDATWLHMQHDNLTWLGGDINLNAENGLAAWKSTVYWVDTPRQVTVAPLPTWSAWDLGLDKLEDVLIWIGYSNTFCQFARAGWFHAILGCLALVLFSSFSADGIGARRAGIGFLVFTAAGVVLVAVALSGPFRSKSHLDQAAHHLRQGELENSLRQLQRSAELFPALSQDTHFVAQKALIEHRLRRNTDYAKLHRAKQLESSGKYDQAFEHWSSLCDSTEAAVRRESLRSVLRYAIQDYNCNRIRLSKTRLEFVLRRQPGNVKVIYYLQHLSIRQKEPATTYQMCDWMYEVTNFLNFQTKKTLRAVSEQNAVLAATLDEDVDELWRRSIRSKQR